MVARVGAVVLSFPVLGVIFSSLFVSEQDYCNTCRRISVKFLVTFPVDTDSGIFTGIIFMKIILNSRAFCHFIGIEF